MDAKLKERAQKVAAMGNRNHGFTPAEFREIEEVYKLVIGRHKDCYSCVVYGLISEISQTLIQQPLILKDMANAKGRFVSGRENIKIIRHGKNGTTVITPENINEGDNFQWVASQKSLAHNVEEVKGAKAEAITEAKAATPTTSKKKRKAAAKAAAKPAEPTPAATTTEPTTAAE